MIKKQKLYFLIITLLVIFAGQILKADYESSSKAEAVTDINDAANIPPVSIVPDLFNWSEPNNFGLKMLPVQMTIVYKAEPNWSYSHTPNLTIFKDKLYLMWSNGKKHEDDVDQRILCSESGDGTQWSVPKVLAV